ncbi:response regulator transcription factor [Streptomyces sp. H27-C3]|uniref:response regulator transcription factor n=1 Tax=Streptomyces sp. H27-C3 TaxID=3046305 RepID=UPI0024BA643B|nr:response regulator transcription factor [Streptomyces sp. H27-C3]MDJ0466890.1 response regulator transcription factor [Streptomyces sp. H27-C3]
MRVLVAEDEPMMAEMISRGLTRHGFVVDVVHDGDAALFSLEVGDYDVLLLDRDLPGTHGDEVAARMAGSGVRTRILMLTAASAMQDLVEGLNLGADDYLTKPFEYPELIARVKALCRRSTPPTPPVLHRSGIELDTVRHTATRDGRPLALTPKEFAVLRILLTAEGVPVSTEQLLAQAWDEHTDPFTTAVQVTMSKMRAKLGDPPLIATVHGIGYRL